MTKQEAAIVTAYTGMLIGDFGDAHEYMEKIMDRPIFTHELIPGKLIDEIKEKSIKNIKVLLGIKQNFFLF